MRILDDTKRHPEPEPRLFDEEAFNNYLEVFLRHNRVELCPPAYEEDILEQETDFDTYSKLEYNKLVRDGRERNFAPVLNFVVQVFLFSFVFSYI
jgi:hypothetical protein